MANAIQPVIVTLTPTSEYAYQVDSKTQMQGDETIAVPSTSTQTTGVIRFIVPRKSDWIVRANSLLIAKFHDDSDAEFPRTTQIHVGFKHPANPVINWICTNSYAPWRGTSEDNQRNQNYQAGLVLAIPKNYRLAGDMEIWFGLSQNSGSSVTLDWANSVFELDVLMVPSVS